jgi:CTP-dependent riboflavin kinase
MMKKERRYGQLVQLNGIVSSGLGRAHVFMSQPHYQDQFRTILGTTAWPGTLNVKVEDVNLVNYIALRKKAGIDTLDAEEAAREGATHIDVSTIESIRVRGFLRDGVSFGGATAYQATIAHEGNNIPCAILIPDLTRHVDVVEVISGPFLRERLEIEDGAEVSLTLAN